MLHQLASSLKHIITRQKRYNLETATGMADWASNPHGTLAETCERAGQFGAFLIHYEDRKEAKTALTKFVESICRNSHMARWMRRDILFNASRHFLEPDFEDLAEQVLNGYEDGEELYDQVMQYHAATPAQRIRMRDDLDPEILALLDDFYRRVCYYRQNAEYILELEKLSDAIMCEKYGI